MENKTLWTAALMLFLAAAAAAQVHDIEVAAEYSQSVGGIRITYNNASILDEAANLSVGRIYEIRYKIRNLGDFSEKANISVLVSNLTQTWVINVRSRSVAAKKSIYLAEDWDTKDLPEGNCTLLVHAMVPVDSNSSNDLRTRNITLWGHAAATTTTTKTTTSRTTSTQAATTSSPTSSTSSTTRVEDEEEKTPTTKKTATTSRTTSTTAVTSSSTSTSRTAPTQAASTSSSTTSSSTMPRTTSLRPASIPSSTTTTSSSTVVNAATGNAVGASSDGRQTVVVFLVLVSGAVLYLSRK